MEDMVIKNGTIVTEKNMFKADIEIKDGKIVKISDNIKSEGKVIDAQGKLVLPGAIDVHTHLCLPFNGTTSADDYYDGTVAAAFGGTTTVFNYINQVSDKTMMTRFEEEFKNADSNACIDFAFHFGIGRWNSETESQVKEVVDKGVTSFKIYTTYKKDNLMLDESEISDVLKFGKENDLLICVHAEDNDTLEKRREDFIKEGKTTPYYHYLSRDEEVEAKADKMIISKAEKLDAPVYIVHLACEDGYKEVKKAKEQGYKILAETCPTYLEFTSDVYKKDNASEFVCSPPVKGEKSRKALIKGLADGVIDTVATDHCPFTKEQKDMGKDDFTKIPNGCPGVENRYPYMLSLANKGTITYQDAVRLCCFNPSQIFGCATKGSIEVGKDADIVIYNPQGEVTCTKDKMHSKIDYTIWKGVTTKGKIETTISDGNVIVDNDTFYGCKGSGRYLERSFSSIFNK